MAGSPQLSCTVQFAPLDRLSKGGSWHSVNLWPFRSSWQTLSQPGLFLSHPDHSSLQRAVNETLTRSAVPWARVPRLGVETWRYVFFLHPGLVPSLLKGITDLYPLIFGSLLGDEWTQSVWRYPDRFSSESPSQGYSPVLTGWRQAKLSCFVS